MRPETVARKYNVRLEGAVAAVRSGMKLRAAEQIYRIPRSTIHLHVGRSRLREAGNLPPSSPPGRRPVFTTNEEGVVVELLCRYSDKGIPLNRQHAAEAFEIIINRFPPARRAALPFRDGRPGAHFLRNFMKRNEDRLCFGRPLRQEAKRFTATNAEALTAHFANLARLVEDLNLDASRVWNLDETGGTPGKDISGASAPRRFLRRDGTRDVKVGDFMNVNRVTMMPVVSAAGDCGPTLFVFKGTNVPYRNVLRNGVVVTETYSTFLPRGAVVAMREKRGGVDSTNFLSWAKEFVSHVRDLTAGGRKILLIYDAYRSHMTLAVLELFRDNNIEVLALPAHTSGKTQPCDVVLFSAFKARLNECVQLATAGGSVCEFDTYDFCGMLKDAFYSSFTRQNIAAAFCRCGIWPLSPARLLSVPRPRSADDSSTVLTVLELDSLLQEKLRKVRTGMIGEGAKLCGSGFIDTSNGMVLTSEPAIALAREKAEADQAKKAAEDVKANRRALKAARAAAREQKDIARKRHCSMVTRARLSNMGVEEFQSQVRPMAERRALARLRVSLQRQCGVRNGSACESNFL